MPLLSRGLGVRPVKQKQYKVGEKFEEQPLEESPRGKLGTLEESGELLVRGVAKEGKVTLRDLSKVRVPTLTYKKTNRKLIEKVEPVHKRFHFKEGVRISQSRFFSSLTPQELSIFKLHCMLNQTSRILESSREGLKSNMRTSGIFEASDTDFKVPFPLNERS